MPPSSIYEHIFIFLIYVHNNEPKFIFNMKDDAKLQRKEKEFRFRRAEILEQAERIFTAKGFHETTMAEIAGSSGFSTGNLYRFFSGKEELYSAMVMEKVTVMYAQIADAVSRDENVHGKIRALVSSHFDYVENHTDFYRLLIGHESGLRTEGLKKLREHILDEHRKHIDDIEDLLREGIRGKVLRALDPKSMAIALIGIVAYFKYAWIMNPESTSLSEKVDHVLDVYLRGVAKDKEF
jgi:AcrR family transcriptional regulator